MIMERKEAIEVVKKNYPHCAESGTQFETALRTLIPELCESEDEKIRKSIISLIQNGGYMSKEDKEKAFAWLEKQGEQNFAWSEDDDAMLDSAIKFVEHCGFSVIGKGKLNVIAWLNELKDRVQPQAAPAWTEDDEEKLDWLSRVIYSCTVRKGISLAEESELGNWIDKWLNHAPQNTWKPSDEQMEALAWALSLAKNCGEECAFDLGTLQDQLKKLREE